MNKNIIIKALTKAQNCGMNPTESADLIEKYLEIAMDLGPIVTPPPLPYTGDIATTSGTVTFQHGIAVSCDQPIEAPPQIGRVLNAPKSENDAPWTTDSLSAALSNVDWQFVAKPEGWEKELTFQGSPQIVSPEGKGLFSQGVKVTFRCVEMPFKDTWHIFFPITEAEVNPAKSMDELKLSLSQLLRKRNEDIVASTKQSRASYPDTSRLSEGGGFA